MENTQRKTRRGRRDELLTLLNGWDPADLLEAGAPRDQYESVVDELLAELARAAGKEDIAAFLERAIRESFGVTPKDSLQFATRAVTWYELASREDASELEAAEGG